MTSSEEFKQAIREGRLNDAFAIAISKTPELHITTKIASETNTSESKSWQTHLNLIEGTISNEIEEELINDNLYDFVQQFHYQQISQGNQIINQNLQSIQQLFRLLAILQQQKQGKPYTPISNWKIDDRGVSSPEDNAMALAPELDVASEEDDDIVNELLSLDDIDIEVESPPQPEEISDYSATPEVVKNDEDWGDWLNEDSLESDNDVIVIDELDIEQSEDWQSEDWGDETEFIDQDRK